VWFVYMYIVSETYNIVVFPIQGLFIYTTHIFLDVLI